MSGLTVYVATWGMDYEQDALIAVCHTLAGAKRAVDAHASLGWVAASGGLEWEDANGGSSARFQALYTASVVPVDVQP